MRYLWRRYRRTLYVFIAFALVIATYVPIFTPQIALAATGALLEPRSIQMSDSSPSGNATITTGVGSGTNVDYKVTIGNTDAFSSLVINFCDNSPIIGDTCLNTTAYPSETSPGDMSVSAAAIGTSTNGGAPTTTCSNGNTVGGTGWTLSSPNSYTVVLSSSGSNPICAGGTQTFVLTGITNPDLAYSFYARIYTYASDSPTTATPTAYSSPTTPGSYVDYGGIALATVTPITITAKVQESLSFCIASTAFANWTPGDCSSTQIASNPPSLALGTNVNGNIILTPGTVFSADDYMQLSTNATNGATVYMHTGNTCGGLSVNGGTDNCPIQAVGDYSGNTGGQTGAYDLTTAAAANVALFGLQVQASTKGSDTTSGLSGIGSLTPNTTYNDGTSTDYGMNDTATTGVAGTYGTVISSTTAPCYLVNQVIQFAADSALTTPAGIYTANLSLIATGNF